MALGRLSGSLTRGGRRVSSQVQTGLPRERADSLTRAMQPGLVSLSLAIGPSGTNRRAFHQTWSPGSGDYGLYMTTACSR